MRKPYRLIERKGRNIQVIFDHIPERQLSSGTKNREEAIAWADAKLARDTGQLNPKLAERTTLRDFAQGFFSPSDPKGFIKRHKARGYSYEATEYERRQGYLNNYILPAHGSMLINSISDVLIEDLVLDLKSVRNGRQLSNDTKNKILAAYADVMKEAKRLGYIRINPCETVQKRAGGDGGRRPFTEEEIALFFPEDRHDLLFIWKDLMWATYFAVMKDTGWRPSEVEGLSVLNYFPELHGVFTTGSVHWHDRTYKESVKTTRKGLKNRMGFLSDQTAELIEELIRYNPSRSFLFQLNGRFFSDTTANEHLRDAASRAHIELDGRTQYSFRHTFQDFYLGRMPENARLLLMGHTHTRSEYSHLTPEQSLRRILEIQGVSDALNRKGDPEGHPSGSERR